MHVIHVALIHVNVKNYETSLSYEVYHNGLNVMAGDDVFGDIILCQVHLCLLQTMYE